MRTYLKNKMTIKNRLILIEIISILGMIVIGLVAIITSKKINQASTDIADFWIPSAIAVEELNTDTSDYRIAEHDHILSKNRDKIDELEIELSLKRQKIGAEFERYIRFYVGSDEEDVQIHQAQNLWQQYAAISEEILEISRANETDKALELINGQSKELFDEYSRLLKAIGVEKQAGANRSSEYGNQLYSRLVGWKIALILVLALILSVLIISLIRGMVKSIILLTDGITRVSAGDLDLRLKCDGDREMEQVIRSVNSLAVSLKTMVNDEKRVLGEIASGNLDASSKAEPSYRGDFAAILYTIRNLEIRLKEQRESHAQREEQGIDGKKTDRRPQPVDGTD